MVGYHSNEILFRSNKRRKRVDRLALSVIIKQKKRKESAIIFTIAKSESSLVNKKKPVFFEEPRG